MQGPNGTYIMAIETELYGSFTVNFAESSGDLAGPWTVLNTSEFVYGKVRAPLLLPRHLCLYVSVSHLCLSVSLCSCLFLHVRLCLSVSPSVSVSMSHHLYL